MRLTNLRRPTEKPALRWQRGIPLSWGGGMADELQVDANGLRAAAANSEATGSTLAAGAAQEPSGVASAQPSGTGIAAVQAALSAVRTRQSQRIVGQATDMAASSDRYKTSDEDGAGAITAVSV